MHEEWCEGMGERERTCMENGVRCQLSASEQNSGKGQVSAFVMNGLGRWVKLRECRITMLGYASVRGGYV